jgi:hypothetical protein
MIVNKVVILDNKSKNFTIFFKLYFYLKTENSSTSGLVLLRSSLPINRLLPYFFMKLLATFVKLTVFSYNSLNSSSL